MAFIYRHIRLDLNEPFYIGMSVNYKRPFQRTAREKEWKEIAANTPIRVEILFDDLDLVKAREKEKEFIALYKRQCDGGFLVNKTLGGLGILGFKREPFSENTKTKMSIARKGKPNPAHAEKMKGKDAKNRISIHCGFNEKTYSSLSEAAKDLEISIGAVHNYLNNKVKNKFNFKKLCKL
tara:strand:+ start:490 stop:1029 length:540 start_codon:yes stop_codon:yes gene_type:complete